MNRFDSVWRSIEDEEKRIEWVTCHASRKFQASTVRRRLGILLASSTRLRQTRPNTVVTKTLSSVNRNDHDPCPSLLSTPTMSDQHPSPSHPIVQDTAMSSHYDDLPDLQSVSDSDSDIDPTDIQPSDDDYDMPPLEPIPPPAPTASTAGTSRATSTDPQASSRRRARVEDDEDDERDRRHPSQRVGSPIDHHTANPLPPPPAPPLPGQQQQQRRFFATAPRVRATINFPAFFRTVVTGPDAFRLFQQQQQQGNPNQPNPNTPPPFMNGPQTFLGGIAMSINLNGNPAGNAQPHPHGDPHPAQGPPNPNTNPSPNTNQNPNPPRPDGPFTRPFDPNDLASVRQFFNFFQNAVENFGFDREREPEDPERAKKLIDALEEVPVGLVRRLERVGGSADREKGGDETGAVGGDVGCAICWDKLLDGDGEAWGLPTEGNHATAATPEPPSTTQSASADTLVASSSASTTQNEPLDEATHTHPKIVSLPCAHVFHASCLIPWFSRPRQTTCPTCRFNIDPENLTYVRRRRTPQPGTNVPTAPANPPAPGAGAPDAGRPGGTGPQAQQPPPMVMLGGPGAPPQVFPWNTQSTPNPQNADPTNPSAAAPPHQEQTQAPGPATPVLPDATPPGPIPPDRFAAARERIAEARRGVTMLEGLRNELVSRLAGGDFDGDEVQVVQEGEERDFTFGDVMDLMRGGGGPLPPGPPAQGGDVPTAPASENGGAFEFYLH